MRSILLLSLFCLFFFSGCKKEPEKTTALYHFTPYDTSPEYLNGQIKSVREINYWAVEKNGLYEPAAIISSKERDSIQWSYDFTAFYNEAGIITKTDFDAGTGVLSSWIIDVGDGLMRKATYIEQDTPRVYLKLFYDANGKLNANERYRSGVDTLINKVLATLDESGNPVEGKLFNSGGEQTRRYVFTWDGSSRMTEMKIYNSADSLLIHRRGEYNDKGFYIRDESLNAKGEITRTLKVDYKDYDKHGNWLTALIYDNDKPSYIAKREYEYYE